MSALLSFPLFWAQSFLPGVPEKFRPSVMWLLILGEPLLSVPGFLGGMISWLKIMSLLCLLGWVVSWVSAGLKERTVARGDWLDIAALVALLGELGALVLRVLEATGRFKQVVKIGPVPLVTLLAIVFGVVLFVWIESALWRTIRRLGRSPDLLVLAGIHLTLMLGVSFSILLQQASLSVPQEIPKVAAEVEAPRVATWQEGIVYGTRLSATYMGYVVLLRVALLILVELFAVRARRLYSIASLSVVEANRRMWAPWVVITVFLVVLAFTHWFLQPPRPAEMGRLYVGTLALLCSLLLTVMVTILTPLSLPNDIQQQTIYTVVSKPVRRIELIWGRMLGFMVIVTVLVVAFGGISLFYLWRTVGGKINETLAIAKKEGDAGRTTQANHLNEEAEQLRVRMQAREPIKGSLTFLDSRGEFHLKGVDVGTEQSMREPRSHIEGNTPATAVWRFGTMRDPYRPQAIIDRRVPVDRLLTSDTIEWWLDRTFELQYRILDSQQRQSAKGIGPDVAKRLSAGIARSREELDAARGALAKLRAEDGEWESRAIEAEKAGRSTEAESFRQHSATLHSPPVLVEMTFNVYRTTKGPIGEPVFAEIEVSNPFTQEKPFRNIFPIREYYTNKEYVPAKYLAGSRGALKIEIRCLSKTQYLGMAERDLYILARAGDFGTNYMKGLFGVWLQAMVLTAIGVFAGTFLSWPVALLTTIAFFVGGQVAFSFLIEFSQQNLLLGGGPFESLIRLLTHDNQMSELSPTLAVVTAKTFDSIVMPVMSRLVYVVPNFAALDVSNTVADGFEVRWSLMGTNLLLALAYSLPFSIAGYFILKNREVAA